LQASGCDQQHFCWCVKTESSWYVGNLRIEKNDNRNTSVFLGGIYGNILYILPLTLIYLTLTLINKNFSRFDHSLSSPLDKKSHHFTSRMINDHASCRPTDPSPLLLIVVVSVLSDECQYSHYCCCCSCYYVEGMPFHFHHRLLT